MPWEEWGPQEQKRRLREAIGDELYDLLEVEVARRLGQVPGGLESHCPGGEGGGRVEVSEVRDRAHGRRVDGELSDRASSGQGHNESGGGDGGLVCKVPPGSGCGDEKG